MSKAYDRVHWTFIIKLLKGYGFPNHWIFLIQQCISTVFFKSLVNGKVFEAFVPYCGVCQGDPLSPFLFLYGYFKQNAQAGRGYQDY